MNNIYRCQQNHVKEKMVGQGKKGREKIRVGEY